MSGTRKYDRPRLALFLGGLALLAIAIMLITGCGSVTGASGGTHHGLPTPSTSAQRAALAKTQRKFDRCVAANSLLTHSGREGLASCLGLTRANASKLVTCLEDQALNASIITKHGRELFHAAALSCAEQFS